MSKEERIRITPGYLPDGMEFTAPEPLTEKIIGLGTLAGQGLNDDTGLAGTLMRICAADPDMVAVCGVKLEDNAALVIVFDPADWPLVEPKVITAIERHLDGSGEDMGETIDGIRIVPDADEQSLRHFVCPESMRRGAWHGIASAGMLHDPTEHGSSWLADEIHRISFVRGVLIDDRTVSVAIKDADQWPAAKQYIVAELERSMERGETSEPPILCASCQENERHGYLGTASIRSRCTCEELHQQQTERLERRLRSGEGEPTKSVLAVVEQAGEYTLRCRYYPGVQPGILTRSSEYEPDTLAAKIFSVHRFIQSISFDAYSARIGLSDRLADDILAEIENVIRAELECRWEELSEHRLQHRGDDCSDGCCTPAMADSRHTQRGVVMNGPPERLNNEQRAELAKLAEGFLANLENSET